MLLYFFLSVLLVQCTCTSIGNLRNKERKARTGTAVDAGNFRESRLAANYKMCTSIYVKDGDVNNLNFVKAIRKSNDIL